MKDSSKIDDLLNSYSKEFEVLTQEYLGYNSHTNISAIRDQEEVYEKHYRDSLVLVDGIQESLVINAEQITKRKIIDIGSGGGFPVLPLAIVMKKDYQEVEFTALDSVAKKTKFIEHMKKILGLENLNVYTDRAEVLAHDKEHRESYDLVLARAVANLPTLLEYCIPFLKPEAFLIASKSTNIADELKSADNAFEELDSKVIKVQEYGDKQLLFIKKLKATKAKYPRSVGKPLKNPL